MSINFISREDALARGLPRYFMGDLCDLLHLSERDTKTGVCLECVARYVESEIKPVNTPRILARRRKQATYVSEQSCPLCGGRERHTQYNDCMGCRVLSRISKGSSIASPAPLPPGRPLTLAGVNKAEARRSGQPTYTAEKPCRWGHAPIRYTKTGQCVQCMLDKRPEDMRDPIGSPEWKIALARLITKTSPGVKHPRKFLGPYPPRESRDGALSVGNKTYVSAPCRRCGHFTYGVEHDDCVTCTDAVKFYRENGVA